MGPKQTTIIWGPLWLKITKYTDITKVKLNNSNGFWQLSDCWVHLQNYWLFKIKKFLKGFLASGKK